jgi:hypothetical protein
MSLEAERTLAELLGTRARVLIDQGHASGSLWDAEVFELAPRLVTTPARQRVEQALSNLGIEVVQSAVWISAEDKRRLLDERRQSRVDLLNRPPGISDPASHPSQRDQYERELSDLAIAFNRLEDGEYGECSNCSKLIEWVVLRSIPEKLYDHKECELEARAEAWKLDSTQGYTPSIARPSAREMDELHRLAGNVSQPGSVWFSCNTSRQVWPSPAPRYTAPAARRLVHGQNAYLDAVVRLVLAYRPGGRFSIDRRQIAVGSRGQPILQF